MKWIVAILVLISGCARCTGEPRSPPSREPPRPIAQVSPQLSPSEILHLIHEAHLSAPVLPPPPGVQHFEYDRFVVVVAGRDGGTRRDDEIFIGGTDLPERPILAAWRIGIDGGESVVSAAPWTQFDEIPLGLGVRTLWAGLESSPGGETFVQTAVLVPGGSSGASVHVARTDGGWKVVSVDHEWVE